jgi:arginine decarboxylase
LSHRPIITGRRATFPALVKLAETLGAPLVVDNSHGSHLLFYDGGAAAIRLGRGAALVVDSLHKTLPALTGAALLHAARRHAVWIYRR